MTSEEVRIKLGIDTASMKMGLDSARGYMSRWREQQKSEENQYTHWWKNELKKRDDAEIESASRRNRARALRRQRAEKREEEDGGLEHILGHGLTRALGALGVIHLVKDTIESIKELGAKIRELSGEEDDYEKKKAQGIMGLSKSVKESAKQNADTFREIAELPGFLFSHAAAEVGSFFGWLGELSMGSKARRIADEAEADAKLIESWNSLLATYEDVNQQRVEANKVVLDTIAAQERAAADRLDADLTRRNDYQRAKFHKLNDLEKQGREAGKNYNSLQAERYLMHRDLSAVSLSEAQRITAAAVGGPRLAGLHFSRNQMDSINLEQQLQEQAQQARIDGNASKADKLENQRRDLLKKMPFLSEAERDPFAKIDASIVEQNKKLMDLLKSSDGIYATIVGVKE